MAEKKTNRPHELYKWASLVSQLVKKPPAMWETWVPSLVWEDPLEKGTATHSVFCSGEFHGLYSPWGRRVGQDWTTFTFKELRKSQRFRVSGRREVPVTAPETLGCWLIEDYAQWHVCTSVTLLCLWVSRETNHLPNCLRTSELSCFFHSLLSNCLSLMGKGTVRFNFSVKGSK